ENQPFSLNFANGNFSIIQSNRNYNYDKPDINNLIFPFDASSLNFNATNFEFTSVSLNEFGTIESNDNSITFKFDEGTFDFSSLTSRSSLAFEFDPRNADFYDLEYNNLVRIDENFSFDAAAVTFRSDSVTFDFRPSTLNFDPSAFAANANLYDYKLNGADFAAGVSFEQFNASDYRALDYAFAGDELFNSQYYTNQGGTPSGMNPFADYIENGFRAGRNPNGLFNVNYYLDNNSDVKQFGGDPLTHYALFGGSEIFDSRDPNQLFDSSYYLAKNPDVAAAGVNPLLHYIQFGWKESRIDNPGGFNPNRDPNPFFSTSDYFELNEDVLRVSNILPSANPVQHMLEFGFVEGRITTKAFESPNTFKFSKTITPDSDPQDISNAQKDFNKANLNLTPKEDGTFEISQISPVDDLLNPYTAVAVTLYFLVGGAIVLRNSFGNFESNSEFVFDDSSSFSGYGVTPPGASTTDVVTINYGDPELEDLLSGTRAFPGQTESERQVEIFVTPGVDGVEDFTILPVEEGLFIPTTEFPQGNPILEDILNEGLFLGGEETLQGAYFLSAETIIETDSYEQARN
ncbi:MAG: hypothetical protein AAFW67_11925, partial [Cyanobacteria bacterium J06638_38]